MWTFSLFKICYQKTWFSELVVENGICIAEQHLLDQCFHSKWMQFYSPVFWPSYELLVMDSFLPLFLLLFHECKILYSFKLMLTCGCFLLTASFEAFAKRDRPLSNKWTNEREKRELSHAVEKRQGSSILKKQGCPTEFTIDRNHLESMWQTEELYKQKQGDVSNQGGQREQKLSGWMWQRKRKSFSLPVQRSLWLRSWEPLHIILAGKWWHSPNYC